MNKKAIITVGISASGKSTWAEKFVNENKNWVIVCRDEVRKSYHEETNETTFSWRVYNWKNEPRITEICDEQITHYSNLGRNIIIADTNLNKFFREEREEMLRSLGYEVELKIFDLFLYDALIRDSQRQNPVGQEVISKQYFQFCSQFKKQVEHHPFAPNAIIVDIDSTLSENTSGRSIYDYSRVGEDSLKENIAQIVRRMSIDHKIIILSTREEYSRENTKKWLIANKIPFDAIFLRENKDYRPSYVVEEEIFRNKIEGVYNITFVLDDNKKVLIMFNSIGLQTLSVGKNVFL